MSPQFAAPWSSRLKLITWSVTALLVAISALGTIPAVVAWSLLLGSAAFSVRGYTVARGELWVHRIGWTTRLPLDGRARARVDPDAMRGSVRTFGNGGLFAFAGRFRNAALGPYRAFVTDAERSVVVDLGGQPVVVTPDRPEAFAEAVRAAR